jgi:hypothetical protein
MIVLSRSPASPSSDHDNGGQTAANPVDLLSQCWLSWLVFHISLFLKRQKINYVKLRLMVKEI